MPDSERAFGEQHIVDIDIAVDGDSALIGQRRSDHDRSPPRLPQEKSDLRSRVAAKNRIDLGVPDGCAIRRRKQGHRLFE